MLYFQNRKGEKRALTYYVGETIADVLLRNKIPPTSVITTCGEAPVSEYSTVEDEKEYIVRLIEGYDISTITQSLDEGVHSSACAYVKNRMYFTVNGELQNEHIEMSIADVVKMVDDNIEYALNRYKMIQEGDVVLVGLSGGVDSSSLLIALSKLQSKLKFKLIAATFEDFDSLTSPTFANAKKLANEMHVEHRLIRADLVTKAFNLQKPIIQILPELMNTEYGHFAMYIDHHTTRRALEIFADEIGANKIVLGLHTTDLLGGLLNSFATGYAVGDMFKREIGDYTYIYPLCFVPKKELHIYYYAHMGRYAVHSYPNAWELNPQDRNYYYYLGDMLQVIFPGIENYLLEANSYRNQHSHRLQFTRCGNCGAFILKQPGIQDEAVCDVCRILKILKYTKEG